MNQVYSLILLTAIGGAFGSVGRYLVGLYTNKLWGDGFPWGTIAVNIIGSFLIGLAVEAVTRTFSNSAEVRVLVITGFLGGFTTFSSFSIETMKMLERGELFQAGYYLGSTLVFGVIAVFCGLSLGKALF
ncbi:fluoride efflux transporter CrcB [Pseudoruegeria sp. SK021]|uniref:fluoride efflux transporter CrcB n=1 Tax=Pseudoruegeria sp. SK021 TaxID=1933035 RepID=UPI000A238930|nr:fluoride efflux transporter CrcB [Pseudoruegeria sp. SK021]OSP53455.1 hypothetical protein BV911_17870 [Pseudoruegeria sp. SK021]